MAKTIDRSVRGKVCIVGVGTSKKVGRVPGVSPLTHAIEASKAALDDAGLKPSDIDGVVSSFAMASHFHRFSIVLSEAMKIRPTYSTNIQCSGATGAASLNQAAAAVAGGLADVVLFAIGDALLSGLTADMALKAMSESRDQQYEMPFGIPASNTFAMIGARHAHVYGTTPEQRAAAAVIQRKHAVATPGAQMKEPITIEDVLNSKMVTTPYRKLECSLISDGGVAWIVTTPERAKAMKKKPIYILGVGECYTQEHIFLMEDLTQTGGTISSKKAYDMAGVKPKDFDVAGIYDCFTGIFIINVEDLGFCKKGEGGAFVAAGNTTYGGQIPANTHGGLLSYAHIGIAGSVFHLIEVVRQLRGECGPRQVKGAELGLYHSIGGGMSSIATTVLGTEATL
ncbi:MAG: thiolase [Alphaproteobacteria bacterium]